MYDHHIQQRLGIEPGMACQSCSSSAEHREKANFGTALTMEDVEGYPRGYDQIVQIVGVGFYNSGMDSTIHHHMYIKEPMGTGGKSRDIYSSALTKCSDRVPTPLIRKGRCSCVNGNMI